jgi:hypothetical protein
MDLVALTMGGLSESFKKLSKVQVQASGCLNTKVALVPPKPKELDTA